MHRSTLRHSRARLVRATALVAVAPLVLLLTAAGAGASTVSQDGLPSAVPSAATPNLNDGNVFAITQVGSRMLLGGSFTSVSPPGSINGAGAVPRRGVLAFDAGSGAVDGGFHPQLDGDVQGLAAGPTPGTVYVAGTFNTVNGAVAKSIALLDLSNGQLVSGFSPAPMNGSGQAVQLVGGHLILAGTFTTVGGSAHGGIVSLDPRSGAVESYLGIQLAGHHSFTGLPGQSKAPVGGRKMDISADGSQLVLVGNFTTANGMPRDQILRLNLGAAAGTVDGSWSTLAFTAICGPKYDTYVRDISYSPDGSYFIVATTGSGGPGATNNDGSRALCDSASRFNNAANGSNVKPAWIDYTGNDSLESALSTGAVVYVGGHQRWLNNANGKDNAGAGAVPRPGIAALDPVTGLPLSWNPGRNPRGAGAYALYASPQGVYVGSDTTFIGNRQYYRGRIAAFPLAGGSSLPSTATAVLPGTVFSVGPLTGPRDALRARSFDGSAAGAAGNGPASSTTWSQARGAVLIGNQLFYGWSDGTLRQRTLSGAALGNPQSIDPYNDPFWSTVPTGSRGTVYRGTVPTLYGAPMRSVTGMVYAAGRLYYSIAGQPRLRSRAFTPESGILGATETVEGGSVDLSGIAGMFLSAQTLYYAAANGSLHAVPFAQGSPTTAGDRVANSTTNWRAHGLFLG